MTKLSYATILDILTRELGVSSYRISYATRQGKGFAHVEGRGMTKPQRLKLIKHLEFRNIVAHNVDGSGAGHRSALIYIPLEVP